MAITGPKGTVEVETLVLRRLGVAEPVLRPATNSDPYLGSGGMLHETVALEPNTFFNSLEEVRKHLLKPKS